jgi:hypothetical protein
MGGRLGVWPAGLAPKLGPRRLGLLGYVVGEKLFGEKLFGEKLFGEKSFGEKLFGEKTENLLPNCPF